MTNAVISRVNWSGTSSPSFAGLRRRHRQRPRFLGRQAATIHMPVISRKLIIRRRHLTTWRRRKRDVVAIDQAGRCIQVLSRWCRALTSTTCLIREYADCHGRIVSYLFCRLHYVSSFWITSIEAPILTCRRSDERTRVLFHRRPSTDLETWVSEEATTEHVDSVSWCIESSSSPQV